MRRAESVHELLQLHDRRFVEAAYWSLLGRAPAPEESALYVRLLREGHDKEAILYACAKSKEAEAHLPRLHDMEPFLRLQNRLHTSPIRRLVKLVYVFRRQRLQMNRIENAIGRLEVLLEAMSKASPANSTPRDALATIKAPRARAIFRQLRQA